MRLPAATRFFWIDWFSLPSHGSSISLLQSNLGHSAHQFWDDDIGLVQAMALLQRKIVGHRQVTDAYLLALAIHKNGRLATLDRKLTALLREKTFSRDVVIVI